MRYDPEAILVIGNERPGEETVDECDSFEEAKEFISNFLNHPDRARIIRGSEYVSPEEQEELDEQDVRNEKYMFTPWKADGFSSPYAWVQAMEYAG